MKKVCRRRSKRVGQKLTNLIPTVSELSRSRLWPLALVLLFLCRLPLPFQSFLSTLLVLLLLLFKATLKMFRLPQNSTLPVSITTTASADPPSRAADAAARLRSHLVALLSPLQVLRSNQTIKMFPQPQVFLRRSQTTLQGR
jgi:hypothetical protein